LGVPVYVGFFHEPEDDTGTGSGGWGTTTDYQKAWQHIRHLFDADGVTNATWTWVLMAWHFDLGDAGTWYPGDDVIDVVASDGYNWAGCRTDQGGTGNANPSANWKSFQQVFQASVDFAVLHNKPFIATEIGTAEDPTRPTRKGDWI